MPYKDPVKRDAMAKVYKARWYREEQDLVTKARTRSNKTQAKGGLGCVQGLAGLLTLRDDAPQRCNH
jgi:hypothetical protein